MSEQEVANQMHEMKKLVDQHQADIANLKERTKIWQSYFHREFVAVIVGAVLLIIFAGFLMMSMWNNVKTTEVIANGFFVLLGFFFSQTAKATASKEGRDPENTMR